MAMRNVNVRELAASTTLPICKSVVCEIGNLTCCAKGFNLTETHWYIYRLMNGCEEDFQIRQHTQSSRVVG